MISRKIRDALSDGDEDKRLAALNSIKKIDPSDLEYLVQSARGFDESYLDRVVQVIGQGKDERSALVISSILFASTEQSQERIRTKCLQALSQNPTDTATNALMCTAKNEKFYKTQCQAVKALGSRKKEHKILALLEDIVMENNYFPSTEEARRDPGVLVLSALEALSSESLKNESSALVILEKISDSSCKEVYREQGAERLAQMGLESLADPVLDKAEENIARPTVMFALLAAIKGLKKTPKQKQKIHGLIEQILPKVNQDQALNQNLVSLMNEMIDAKLVDVISSVTYQWPLSKPAGASVIEILKASPKNSFKTITALLRYAESAEWKANKNYVLPNLNKCYYEKPIHVIRKTFENNKPNYVECRKHLTEAHNTQDDRALFVRNVTVSLQTFSKGRQQDMKAFNEHVPNYFEELKKILLPRFDKTILDEDWRLCTTDCLYPVIGSLPKITRQKRESLHSRLTNMVDCFLSINTTSKEFLERASTDWLGTRTRSQAKYILEKATEIEKHRKTTLELVIRRSANHFWKFEDATGNEIQFQKWVAEDIVSAWKEGSKEFLVDNLTKDGVFNEWVYDTLRAYSLLDGPTVVMGLNSQVSDLYRIRLLEDLSERYTDAAENLLAENIRHGRSAEIRAAASKVAGEIFDYNKRSDCPVTILQALHGRFSEQGKEVRESLYISLGRICSAESIDPLQQAKIDDKKLERPIKQALGNIFSRFSTGRPRESNIEPTISWITVMGKLGDERALKLLKPYVESSTYHPEKVRLAAVEAIGRVGGPEGLQFLEELRGLESHDPEMKDQIDRAIGLASDIGDFDLFDVLRKLTDGHPTVSDPKLNLTQLFGDRAKSIKAQCARAYKAWLGGDYSYYVTHLNNVCDPISKRMMDVFKEELFQDDHSAYIHLRRTNKVNRRYEMLRSKPRFRLIGSCFCTINALRVEAPVPHGEDSRTDEAKTELSPEDGQLAKDNFVNAITKSVEMLKEMVIPKAT